MNRWLPFLFFLSMPCFAGDQSQLDQDVPCPPYDSSTYRILFIGDSITRHGVNDRTISSLGWTHVSGMAASKSGNDFANVLSKKISTYIEKPTAICFHTYGGSGSVAERLAAMDKVINIRPNLVVVQLGEHESKELGGEKLASAYRKLLETIVSMQGKPRVIALGPWAMVGRSPTGEYSGWPGDVDKIMSTISLEQGVKFSSVRDISALPEASGWGKSAGVKWHPNDIGHLLYAERIYRLFLEGEVELSRKK